MNINSEDLILDLIQRTSQNSLQATAFYKFPNEILRKRLHPESWNILECIQHLNLYGNFYIPEIRKQISATPYKQSDEFQSGWLGNYFAKSMLPTEKRNSMKTFKSMNPLGDNLDKKVLEHFIEQQKELLELLELSKKIDLNRTKTKISISKWIHLRLGDTFRIVIYHNERHIAQANKIQS